MRRLLCLILTITVAVNSTVAFTADEEYLYRPWWCNDCACVVECSHPAPYMRGDVNGDGRICTQDAYMIIFLMSRCEPELLLGRDFDMEAAIRAASTMNLDWGHYGNGLFSSSDALSILIALARPDLPQRFLTNMPILTVGECGCCYLCECREIVTVFAGDCCSRADCTSKWPLKQLNACVKQLCKYYTRPGQILSINGPITTADVLEILKFIVGLPSVIDTDERAARAAIVRSRPNERTGAAPTMADASELLKHIVGLPTVIDELDW